MSNGWQQFSQRIMTAITALKQTQEARAYAAGANTLAAVQNRIVGSGRDGSGNKFPQYSDKEVPKHFYYGRSRSGQGERRVRSLRSKTLSYRQFRQLNNLQTAHVDLYFTGQMWRGTEARIVSAAPGRIVVRLQGRTQEAAQKIEWNSIRYGGPVLAPTKKERDAVNRIYRSAIIAQLKKSLTPKPQ